MGEKGGAGESWAKDSQGLFLVADGTVSFSAYRSHPWGDGERLGIIVMIGH